MRISDWSSDVCSSDLLSGDYPVRTGACSPAGPAGARRLSCMGFAINPMAERPRSARIIVAGQDQPRMQAMAIHDLADARQQDEARIDRKSTRLNSSH